MTNVSYTFTERRQAALAESAASAWEEVCGDYDPFQKGDGNYDASMRRETVVPYVGEIVSLTELEVQDSAHGLPTIPHRSYWDIEEFPESAPVIFPGKWLEQ